MLTCAAYLANNHFIESRAEAALQAMTGGPPNMRPCPEQLSRSQHVVCLKIIVFPIGRQVKSRFLQFFDLHPSEKLKPFFAVRGTNPQMRTVRESQEMQEYSLEPGQLQ